MSGRDKCEDDQAIKEVRRAGLHMAMGRNAVEIRSAPGRQRQSNT